MRDYEFRWIEWNVAKCHKHNVFPEDAEYVVRHATRPFPARIGDKKVLVWGQTHSGMYLQVIMLIDPDGSLFVIHAMPMTQRQIRQFRRRRR